MSNATRATRALDAAKVSYRLHPYDYDADTSAAAGGKGLQAAAASGKAARMMEVADAERRTGYKVGGISPFGQQRPVPVWFELDACNAATVFINAGQRGLLLELSPADALSILNGKAANISR